MCRCEGCCSSARPWLEDCWSDREPAHSARGCPQPLPSQAAIPGAATVIHPLSYSHALMLSALQTMGVPHVRQHSCVQCCNMPLATSLTTSWRWLLLKRGCSHKL